MAAPGSRLSDDLYSLYVAGIAWLLLPIYGNGLAVVLPSDFGGFERTRDITAVAAILGAGWIGYRGGPFLVSRANVLHEIGSPQSLRRSLLPRFLRQAVAYAALGAIAVTVLLAMSDAESFGFSEAGKSSVVVILAMVIAVSQAVGWLTVFKGHSDRRWLVVAANLVMTTAVGLMVGLDRALSSGPGEAVLAVVAAGSLGMAVLLLDRVPVAHLWRRASALEEMRSAMQSFDFQQVLVNLRRAADHSNDDPNGVALARPWMPLQIWRYAASIEHSVGPRLVQFTLSTAVVAALLYFADPSDGIVVLAMAGVAFLVGIELASSVAATAGQMVFLVHYRHGSAAVLRRQVAVAVGLGLVLALVGAGWKLAVDPAVGGAVVGLVTFAALAATAQGRLGSPDLAGLASTLGPGMIGPALWARALFGPILTVAMTILVSHRWLHPDPRGLPWESMMIMATGLALFVATYPMEKRFV